MSGHKGRRLTATKRPLDPGALAVVRELVATHGLLPTARRLRCSTDTVEEVSTGGFVRTRVAERLEAKAKELAA